MWIPTDAADIERAAKARELEETPSFDAKAELPQPKKNVSLAIDVAAMSTDGGSLLYGVGEDEHERPTIPKPLDLKGAGDRVGQVVSTSIAEVPYIDVREYPCDDDPSRGYLMVLVPASDRAPHQVTVGQDLRFYGRGAKGNRILSEGEVARLYERRERWQVDRATVLRDVVANAPVPPVEGKGYIHAFARPVALDPAILERAFHAIGSQHQVHQWLLQVIHPTKLGGAYGPSLERAAAWSRHGADMWRLSTHDEQRRVDINSLDVAVNDPNDLVDLDLNLDGRGHLFCGRATDKHMGAQEASLIEVVIAGNLEAFFAVMAAVYDAAGYHGSVDIGVALTGIAGARSELRNQRHSPGPRYPNADYSRTKRVAARELGKADEVSLGLLRHLFAATTEIEGWDPFNQEGAR